MSYNVLTLSVPGSSLTDAYGINDSGEIVGLYEGGPTSIGGFLYANGSFTTIDVPSAIETEPFGINDSDEIVGTYYTATGVHGFEDVDNTFTTIDVPGAERTFLNGVNNSGEIVGEYDDNAGNVHFFLDIGGTITTIDKDAVIESSYITINNIGQIVGSYTNTVGTYNFLDVNGTITTIEVPGVDDASVVEINDAGQIIGGEGGLGFVDTGGTITTFANGYGPVAINDKGEIIGRVEVGGSNVSFIATVEIEYLSTDGVTPDATHKFWAGSGWQQNEVSGPSESLEAEPTSAPGSNDSVFLGGFLLQSGTTAEVYQTGTVPLSGEIGSLEVDGTGPWTLIGQSTIDDLISNGGTLSTAGLVTINGVTGTGGTLLIENVGTLILHVASSDPMPDTVSVDEGGALSGFGTVKGAIGDDGAIVAAGGLLTLDGSVSGTGTAEIDDGATLELGGSFAQGGTVSFAGASSATAVLDDPADFQGTIKGVEAGDTIDLASVSYSLITSASLNPTTDILTIAYGGGNAVGMQLSGNYQNSSFGLYSDGNGGTDIIDFGESPQIDVSTLSPESISSQTVILAGSNMVFVNTYTNSVSDSYLNAIVTAENFYQAHISNSVTLYCSFDTAKGDADTGGFAAENLPAYYPYPLGFPQLESTLAAHATSANDEAAVVAIGNLSADFSGGTFQITDGLAEVLGLPNVPSNWTDTIDLSNSETYFYNQNDPIAGDIDAVGALEHEISEGNLGRLGGDGSAYGVLDLFRYSSPGHLDTSLGKDGLASYFSIGGISLLTELHNPLNTQGASDNADSGDWDTSGTDNKPTSVPGYPNEYDTFGAADLGHVGVVTATDLSVLDVIGWTLTAPCFAAGTRIMTNRREVSVEDLRAGYMVPTVSGRLSRIKWIGHRHVDCARHPRPIDVQPVRVCADALANGQPHHDLLLSPDHAVFIDGVLIPIRYLINGRTIVQQRMDEVTYWHVELERHDVLLAEGLPCESYLDTGNRAAFANGGNEVILHPNFARKVWKTKAYAELVINGPKLAAAKSVVLAQALALGHHVTDDPDLSIVVDGRKLHPKITGTTWRVSLPSTARNVRLVSQTWVPTHVLGDNNDTRSLGVAVANVRADGRTLALDDPRLCSGWHTAEPPWRWTNGDGVLALVGVRGLAFDVVMTGSYWETPAELDKVPASQAG